MRTFQTLKEFRNDRGMTQRVLADLLGVDPSYISQIEIGAYGVTDRIKTDFIELFGVDFEEMYKDVPKKKIDKEMDLRPIRRTAAGRRAGLVRDCEGEMKHRLHPIPFESAIAHIKHNRASRVFVRVNNNYIRVALSCDQSLAEWMDCEYYFEEEYDAERI